MITSPHRTHPSLFRTIQPPQSRAEPTTVHMLGCDCELCDPERVSAASIARWCLAGATTGSAIAFAVDAPGAWHALASVAAHAIGVR